MTDFLEFLKGISHLGIRLLRSLQDRDSLEIQIEEQLLFEISIKNTVVI